MRRAAATVLGTVAGTALLVGAKLGGPPTVAQPPAAGNPVSTSAQPRPVSPSTGAPGRPSTRPSTRPPQAGLRDGRFIGAASSERYGTITVTITVSHGRLTDLTATCVGCGGLSTRISDNAYPTLRQEAVTAQSAAIDTVSGATYTSQAYQTSLQSALDSARG